MKLLNRKNKPDDPNDSDYINANRIKLEDSWNLKTYLATQGPLSSTMQDFWEMVWQEKSQIILMITHEEEKGRVKCARYWPQNVNESQKYGQITVTFTKLNQVCEDYVLREFLLSYSDGQAAEPPQQRKCYQFQYLTWSDHGVPENHSNTLQFVERFNKLYEESDKTAITVHCSAGIGRTGVIIVIDMIFDKLKKFGINCDVDIYKTVYNLRSQRSGMIQTSVQYHFLYSIIRLFIEKTKRKMNLSEEDELLLNNNNNFPTRFPNPGGPVSNYLTSTPKAVSLQSINNLPSTSGMRK